MKHDLRVTFPIMDSQLPEIDLFLRGLREIGRIHSRRQQTNLLSSAVIAQYPAAVDLDNKSIVKVDRVSCDRAHLIVDISEVAFKPHHIEQLPDYHYTVPLLRWAVANHSWRLEMKRF